MDLELRERVYVVTGATDGLGAALGDALVSEGARVVGCGRDQGRVRATADRLGDAALIVSADVSVPGDLERVVREGVERFGRIDGVVNTAGGAAAGRFADVTDDDWTDDLGLKVLAAARLIRLCLPQLREASGASIVNVLNIGARAPGGGSLPTTASRAAGLAM